jgi:DNA-binding NtrC family response regulator
MSTDVVLVVERDEALLSTQAMLFESRGHKVLRASTRSAAEQVMGSQHPDAAVFGHSLSREDREILVAKTRLICPAARILVLHASGADLPVVPHAAIDSREGPVPVLEAFEQLLQDPNTRKPPQKERSSLPKESQNSSRAQR